jgi:glycosyltransferase involved in cell wall biosynthesis
VVLAAHDEEDLIEGALAQLRGLADEIVVVDAGSRDRTAELAARHADRVIAVTNKPMLEINKNVALRAARHEWVLVLDPDERLSATLREQIRAAVERDDPGVAGYWMARRNYILGRWVRTMGLYPGSQLRLVRRGMGAFSEREHHLPMAVSGPVGYLGGDLIHLSDGTLAEIAHKRRRYADFAARTMHARGERFSAARLVRETLACFARQYLLLGGWLEGWTGLAYASLSSYGQALRHLRLRELQSARAGAQPAARPEQHGPARARPRGRALRSRRPAAGDPAR